MRMKKKDLINAALKYIGKPYVWGGESDAEGGYDCSGFIYRALKDAGMTISRMTAQDYFNKFKAYPATKIDEGALLFFGKSANNITHVALGLGDGTMIESIGNKSNTIKNKGKGVSISKITRRRDFVAAYFPCRFTSSEVIKLPADRPNLKIGNRGTKVLLLQKALNYFGAKIKEDGIFGTETFKALKTYQYNHMLVVDGVYGRNTYNSMRSLI